MNFYKKILFSLLFCICFFFSQQASYCVVKINDVALDNSNSFLFISALSTPETQKQPLTSTILTNPDRIYFDINDAVMTAPAVSWLVRNGSVKQVKVSQFLTNPNVVRVVFYPSNKFNLKDISVIDINGNYMFRLNPMHVSREHLSTVFSDEKTYQKTNIEPVTFYDEPQSQTPSQSSSKPTAINTFADLAKASSANSFNAASQLQTPQEKEFRLKTQYYLSRVDVKRGHILISGIGSLSLQNPIYLTNPNRVVYDMPNTVVSPKFKNVEIRLNEGEALKIGQFEPTKVRLVISSENPQVYRPIFSQDLQSVLISNDLHMSGITLFDKSIDISSFAVTSENPSQQTLNIKFSGPVIHSIKKDANRTEIDFYNVLNPNFTSFANAIRLTFFQGMKSIRQKSVGIKYIIPTKNMTVDYVESADSREIMVKLTKHTPQPAKPIVPPETKPQKICSASDLIIIDPGHGGADTGALRAGINEKDINLQISKMVAQILTQKGYKVEMTRWDDKTVSLADRVDFSDARNAYIFVSIHANSSVKSDVEGIETHYWTNDGYELAKAVHPCLSKRGCSIDRGLFKSRFYVINHTKAKSILVEVGFISNDKERNQLLNKDRQRKTAEGIADGIDEFIKMDKKGKK